MLDAQIAPSTCSWYNSMNIRLICFFQDNCEKFPSIINPDFMGYGESCFRRWEGPSA
jgi:hypothetical protein